jgi:succinate dehydrogenase/fumarate reductase-like Fe-S protein
MSPEMVKELQGLQREDARLREVVADLVPNNRTMWPRAFLETCTTRCPEDVEVAKAIDAVKVTILHQGARPLCRRVLGSAGRIV